MTILTGAVVILSDRLLAPGAIVIEGSRITEIREGDSVLSRDPASVDVRGHYIVPGFVDVHVHGLEGYDTLGGPGAVAEMARRQPRFGVTAFCPTTVACAAEELRAVLTAVRAARANPIPRTARVLPAHLESNFINPEYRGAQPEACLHPAESAEAAAVLHVIEASRSEIGIVTLAPEIEGGLELTVQLAHAGHIVSVGHSAASFELGMAAIERGARQATHLFNRMPPINHRNPGLAAAVLQSEDVAAEVICDGFHVHPAMLRVALAAKGRHRVMAITDGTACAGLPIGARAALGGRPITVIGSAAFLDDGTLAGSTATMDQVFRMLIHEGALSPIDAAVLCSTTPAREMGLRDHGEIRAGAVADFTVLDGQFQVAQTYVDGIACL
jgi:N-acetylglucosamine-6-phosphate deacetylase